MRMKFYQTFLLVACMGASTVFAQRSFSPTSGQHVQPKRASNALRTTDVACDTINIPTPPNWSFKLYSAGAGNGFLTGSNVYGDEEKAAYFDQSSTANTYLNKVLIAFAIANSTNPANLTKQVPIYIYDGTMGEPGTLLGTINKTLGDIKTDVDNGNYTEVTLPAAIALPTSKKFFVSVGLTNLTWTSTEKDSLAIYSSDADEVMEGENGFGMENYQGAWGTFGDGWGADFGLYINPLVSPSATCGTAVPVTLASFKGQRNGATNLLTWTTATEINNAGFDVQRSIDGSEFTTIAHINSKANGGNSVSLINYSFEDVKPLRTNNYYRLKQVDKDGKATFTNSVLLKGDKISAMQLTSVYPNPAKNILNLMVESPVGENIKIVVTDLTGKVVLQQAAQLTTGSNQVSLNVVNLPSGNYMVKALCTNGCETAVSKFVKN